MGVLIRETSWLPGFGGGAGGVLEYMASNLSIFDFCRVLMTAVYRSVLPVAPIKWSKMLGDSRDCGEDGEVVLIAAVGMTWAYLIKQLEVPTLWCWAGILAKL